ncbi:hypothetical protein Tco_1059105 [Tanacetum coccineum]
MLMLAAFKAFDFYLKQIKGQMTYRLKGELSKRLEGTSSSLGKGSVSDIRHIRYKINSCDAVVDCYDAITLSPYKFLRGSGSPGILLKYEALI